MKSIYVIDTIWIYALLMFWVLTAVACNEDANMPGESGDSYIPVEVSVNMNIEEFHGQSLTRAGQPLNGDMGDNENLINNVTVFQFDGDGEDADKLVVLRYVDTFGNLKLGLMQPKSDPTKKQFICLVANTEEQLQDFTGTYGDLRNRMISVNKSGVSDGIMIMMTSLQTEVSPGKTIEAVFKRKLAKINVTCSVAEGISFTPARLQLRNVPKYASVNSANETPEGKSDNYRNYISLTENIENGYTWYMPENLRGTGSADSPKNKTDQTAPGGQGDYCTYVELSGLYQESDGTSKLVSYRVYLGNDDRSDYNVEGNRIYNVDMSVSGINTSDGRLIVADLPIAGTPANCYIAVPGTTVVIDMLQSPGTDVSGSGVNYADRVGSATGTNKIKSIGIVWQTEDTPDGLIQDLTYLEATGQAMFKVTPGAAGNLLLAAYSESGQKGEILWSWHIWVSDYDPVTNTKFVSGATWMDRDLGALSAERGDAATIGFAYQWGRKDPFPLSADVANVVLRPLYDANGNYLWLGAGMKDVTSQSGITLITQSITDPQFFYLRTDQSEGTGTWWRDGSITLWNNNTKTIFDPCPAGWRIPIVSNFGGSISSSTTYKGFTWGGLWFQYAAYLTYNAGSIGQMGGTCVHWTSSQGVAYERMTSKITRHAGAGYIGRCVKVAP